MSERYSKLFALPENLYAAGSPVVIAAGALLKDNQTGKILVQLKLQNINDRAIKAVAVKISPLDTVGKSLGEEIKYQYLDLNAVRDSFFGQKVPIALSDASTRAFTITVTEVIFGDNTIWTATDAPLEPLSLPVPLSKALQDNELVKQYQITYGANCTCMFSEEKDLWRCSCGVLNRKAEPLCHKCRKEAAVLAAPDMNKLKVDRAKRLKLEQEQAAAKKAAAEVRMQKIKKQAMKFTPIAALAIVAIVLISGNMKKNAAYNDAVDLAEAGLYNLAITAFTDLGTYKDSAEQITSTKYSQAVELVETRDYDQAVEIFTELGEYKDSQEQLKNIDYIKASKLAQREEYPEAIEAFKALGDFSDSAEQIDKILDIVSQKAIDLVSANPSSKSHYGDVAESRDLLESYSAYGDFSELLEHYQWKIISASGKIRTTTYKYDDYGRLVYDGTAYTYNADGTVATAGRSKFTYDEQGRELLCTTYGSVLTSHYNDSGQLVKQTYATTSGENIYDITYQYNSAGQLISRSSTYNSIENFTYQYDNDGKLIVRTDATGNTLTYTYDKDGNLLSIDGSSGSTKYTYSWVYVANIET